MLLSLFIFYIKKNIFYKFKILIYVDELYIVLFVGNPSASLSPTLNKMRKLSNI